jgi:hypothetical protein
MGMRSPHFRQMEPGPRTGTVHAWLYRKERTMAAYLLAASIATLVLAAAFYAQLRLADFTATPRKLWTARSLLIAVGSGCGYVGAVMYRDPLAQVLAFLIGFGLVHLPASAIVFMKGLRGERPS